jgi:hypothetical protein
MTMGNEEEGEPEAPDVHVEVDWKKLAKDPDKLIGYLVDTVSKALTPPATGADTFGAHLQVPLSDGRVLDIHWQAFSAKALVAKYEEVIEAFGLIP